jgi:hypothetical protein
MNRKDKADRARVMGVKWEWNYKARKWVSKSTVGEWLLWRHNAKWLLASPSGVVYMLHDQSRYAAMVKAGYKIAEVERWHTGR